MGMDNEAVRCCSNKIEWIAGDQCELWMIARLHHLGIFGFDNFGGVDDEFPGSVNGRKENPIARLDPLQLTEKRVPVTCDRGITVSARQRRARHMSGTSMQCRFFCTLENHH